MRKIARLDRNHTSIVRVLRGVGASVESLATVGGGVPDIVVGIVDAYNIPVNLLVEVKDGSLVPSARRLTPDEVKFHDNWKGQVIVIKSEDEAIEMVNGIVADGYEKWIMRHVQQENLSD